MSFPAMISSQSADHSWKCSSGCPRSKW